MSKEELVKEIGEDVVEVAEIPISNGNTLAKVAVAGVVIAAGVGVVMYIRKRKARKAAEVTEEAVLVTEKDSKKKSEA